MIQLAKKTFLGRKKTRLGAAGSTSRGKSLGLPWPAVVWAPRFCKRCGKGRFGEGVWPCLDPWDSVRLRTASTCWNAPGEVWAAWRALFLPCQVGAGGGFGRRVVQPLCLCGNAQGVRADRSTPFGS